MREETGKPAAEWCSATERNRALRGILQRADQRPWTVLRAQWLDFIGAAALWIGVAAIVYAVYVVIASGAGR